MTTDVRATGLYPLNFIMEGFLGTGMMAECLKLVQVSRLWVWKSSFQTWCRRCWGHLPVGVFHRLGDDLLYHHPSLSSRASGCFFFTSVIPVFWVEKKQQFIHLICKGAAICQVYWQERVCSLRWLSLVTTPVCFFPSVSLVNPIECCCTFNKNLE